MARPGRGRYHHGMSVRPEPRPWGLLETLNGPLALCLGIPFVGAGGLIVVAAAGLLPDSELALSPTVGLIGLMLVSFGLLTSTVGACALLRQAVGWWRAGVAGGEAWAQDYPWRPTGIADDGRQRLANVLVATLLLTVGLMPVLAWGLASTQPWWIWGLTLVLLALPLTQLGQALYLLGRWVKYGTSQLVFERFPYYVGEPMTVVLSNPAHPEILAGSRITLRCVEGPSDALRPGGGPNARQPASYDLHRETVEIEKFPHFGQVRLTFELPPGSPSTSIRGEPTRYWVLEANRETPGIDYRAVFLLPIYRRR